MLNDPNLRGIIVFNLLGEVKRALVRRFKHTPNEN